MKQIPDHSYLSTFLDCPRCFFHKFVENLESTEDSLRLLAGSAMHKGLAVHYAGGTPGDACEAVAEEYAEARPMGDLEYLTIGHLQTVLRNYIDYWQDRDPFTVVEMIEEPLVEEVDGMEIGGIPDLLVDHDGDLVVLDHKTTTSFVGTHLYNRVKFSKQGPIYCLLLSKKIGQPVRRIIFNCIYTGKYATRTESKATKFDRYSFEYEESDLQETVRWLESLIFELGAPSPFPSDWPQHGGSHCGWCEFKSLCEVAPSLRDGVKATRFRVRERTGVLLSGADE